MTTVRADPDQIQQHSHEHLYWEFDFTPHLTGEGETVTSAVSYLVDISTGQPYTAPMADDPPFIASPYVRQWVRDPRPGRYRFSSAGTTSAGLVWEIVTVLTVPY